MLQTDWPEAASGVAVMDALHRGFLAGLADLRAATGDDFSIGYARFVAQAEQSFATEERWMEEIEFPGIKGHREQHARVLGALHKVHSHLMSGDLAPARKVVQELLPQWFSFHTSTMGAALAIAMLMASDPDDGPLLGGIYYPARYRLSRGRTLDRSLPGQ